MTVSTPPPTVVRLGSREGLRDPRDMLSSPPTTWEGGIREPGIIHWPGKIKPGISTAVAATYDIFSTSLALAGVAEPSVLPAC